MDRDSRSAFELLPKVELHCHIEGTLRPTTMVDLARKNGVALPTVDLDTLYEYDSLDGFLNVFWLGQSTLCTRDDWARLAYESVLDGAAHGVVYRESFFTPARHLASGQRLADIIEGIDEGLSAGESETGVEYRLIGDIDRAYGPGAGLEFVEQLCDLRRSNSPGSHRIIGVGMDSTEQGIDPRVFKPAYDLARSAGFHLTGHQGENSTATDIALVIDELGAERIDHGLPVLDDRELTARMVDERIPITVCPTSNVLISNTYSQLDQHILPDMRAAGLLATVNTDDPAFIALDLAAEYATVAATFAWDWDTMVQISLDGVEASWLDVPEKSALADRVRRFAASPDGED